MAEIKGDKIPRILMEWEVYGPKPVYNLSPVDPERPDIKRAAKKFGMADLTDAERFDRIWDMTTVIEKVKGGINRIFYPEHPLFDSPFSRFARYIWGTEARNCGDEYVESMLIKAEVRRASLKA